MIIRPARREDVPQIIAIYGMDILKGSQELIADPLPTMYFDAFESIDANPNQVLLVAEENAEIMGSLQITFIQHLLSQARRRAVIEAVFIHPSHQGAGVGTALVQEAIKLSLEANCTALELTTDKKRERAHRFYERLGFKASHEGFKLTLKKP